MAEILIGGVVGVAFTELCNVVKGVGGKVVGCKKLCQDLEGDLNRLSPIVDGIVNCLSSRPDLISEEQLLIVKEFHQTLQKGKSSLQAGYSPWWYPLRRFKVSRTILKLREQVLTDHLQQLLALNTLLAARTMEASHQIAASLQDVRQQQDMGQTKMKDYIAEHMQSVREGLDSVQKQMQDDLKTNPRAVEEWMRRAAPASIVVNDIAHQHHESEQQTSADGLFLEDVHSLVGLNSHIAKVKEDLCESREDDKDMVMILEGMPGIGKTTLALAICKDPQVQGFFEGRIYFFTVSQCPNMVALLSDIWKRVVDNNDVPIFQNEEDARRRLNDRLHKMAVKKRLLVLDDVWSKANMDSLLFEVKGLTTMVTTRQAFKLNIRSGPKQYTLPQLSPRDAERLFCYYAFQQSSIPPTVEEQLVRNVISECKGLPLALKVIGASLSTDPQSPALWRNALKKLQDAKPLGDYHKDRLLGRILTSIEALDPTLRECFVDLGAYPEDCRFSAGPLLDIWVHVRGMEWVDAVSALVELSHRCLLDFDKKVTSADIAHALECNDADALIIHQHDVMRDLALHLAGKDLLPCQRERMFMPHIGKSVPNDWQSERPFAARVISISTTGDMTEDDWPSDLAFPLTEALLLHVIGDSHFYHTPPFIQSMSKLKVLYIRSSTKHSITGPLGASNQLQSIRMRNISPCFSSLDSLGDMHNLEMLQLRNACEVQELPENKLGQSIAMKTLDLRNCTSLSRLPGTLGQLVALEKLGLKKCTSLVDLPESFGHLSGLKELDLAYCYLRHLPETFGQLVALEKLGLERCTHLEDLPESFGHLSGLKELTLLDCMSLSHLPETFGQLVALEKLDLEMCSSLQDLAESFGHLSGLKELHLAYCNSLWHLPETFGQLVALEKLDLLWCSSLEDLPESFGHLSGLKELDLGKCNSLRHLPGTFGQLVALEKLGLEWCTSLVDLPESFGHLSGVKELHLAYCGSLQHLPETFGQLVALEKVGLEWCTSLEYLPESFGHLSGLKELNLGPCTSLSRLPETFGQLVALEKLDLLWCSSLEDLPESFGHLSGLKELDLAGCKSLQHLPETFGQLVALEKLSLIGCDSLQDLPESFGHLSSLEDLCLRDCGSLRRLPETFGQLVALEKLDLLWCWSLEDLPESSGHLSSLEELQDFPAPARNIWVRFCTGQRVLGHLSCVTGKTGRTLTIFRKA